MDPETKEKRSVAFQEYLDTPLHLERTALVRSDAGSGKTSCVERGSSLHHPLPDLEFGAVIEPVRRFDA